MTIKKLLVRRVRLSLIGLFVLAPLVFSAPSIPPGAADAFNSMSPSQQRKLASQYGVDINDARAAAKLSPAEQQALANQYGVSEGDAQAAAAKLAAVQQEDSSQSAMELGAPAEPLESVDVSRKVAQQEASLKKADAIQPLQKQVIQPPLPRFGSAVFNREVTTFAPVDNIPVPQGYLMGVGDNLTVVLYGNDNIQAELTVNREGSINFPLLGPIVLAGMPWIEARQYIEARVSEQLIGTKVVASLGRLRSINVFMAGEVAVPGNYSVSALTTIIQSIYVAGGITPIGTYRDIQVKRGGQTVATLDLYDLLLKGSLADDLRLQTGDVVFVPSALPLVGVQGSVLRPARFEVMPDETLADVLKMAGGTTSRAYLESAVLQRRNPKRVLPELLNLDLRQASQLAQRPVDGDLLTVNKLSDRIENPIFLRGAVERPGVYAFQAGDRISTFIRSADGYLKEETDRDIGLIVRRRNNRLDIEVIPFSPLQVLEAPESEADYRLQRNDELLFFKIAETGLADRKALVRPVVERLMRQADELEFPAVVTLKGALEGAGVFPLPSEARVSDLIELTGGFEQLSLTIDREIGVIARPLTENKLEVIRFNLGRALENPGSAEDLMLSPMDAVYTFDVTMTRNGLLAPVIAELERQATQAEWPQVVSVTGALQGAGQYPLGAASTVSDLLSLVGGGDFFNLDVDLEVGMIVRRKDNLFRIEAIPFRLGDVLSNSGSEENLQLQALDQVIIFNRVDGASNRLGLLAPVIANLERQATQNDWPQVVSVAGALQGAGKYPLGAARSINELMTLAGGEDFFNLNVDLQIGLVVRRKDSLFQVEAVPFNLGNALSDPASPDNLRLQALDEVYVFNQVASNNSNRLALMQRVNDQFKRQAVKDEPPQVMTIDGRVRIPGEYPILATKNLTYLIDLAGGFSEGAYTKNAEIRRFTVNNDQEREAEIIELRLDDQEALDAIGLLSRDSVRVNTIPGWTDQNAVTLGGEIRFPGRYVFEKGEMLSSVLARAGGLTPEAFAAGAVFTNQQAKRNQQVQAEVYIQQMQRQAASQAIASEEVGDSSLVGQSIASMVTGRVTVDLEGLLEGAEGADVQLQDGDSLIVPQASNYVSVIGDVFFPGNLGFNSKQSIDQYIQAAGGPTRFADKSRVFVIKADGRVVSPKGHFWLLGGSKKDQLAAGDVIVVPTNPDYDRPIKRYQAITSVVFQSVASIAAFFSIADR